MLIPTCCTKHNKESSAAVAHFLGATTVFTRYVQMLGGGFAHLARPHAIGRNKERQGSLTATIHLRKSCQTLGRASMTVTDERGK